MARLDALIAAQQGRAEHIQVADGVQRLVLDELALHPQPAGVQDLVAVDDHGVLQRTATGQAGATQGLYLMGEAEGAGGHDLVAEGLLVDDEVHHLIADHGRVEVDLEPHLIAVAGQQGGGLVAFLHPDGLKDLDIADRGFLTAEAGAVQQLDELQRRPVEDRQLRAIHLDHGVGHAQGREGRHQMFDGRQANAGGVLDHGVQAGVHDGLARDRDTVVAVLDVGAHEDDARAGRSRTHGQTHPVARVHAHARDDRRGDGRLLAMVVSDRQTQTRFTFCAPPLCAEFAPRTV